MAEVTYLTGRPSFLSANPLWSEPLQCLARNEWKPLPWTWIKGRLRHTVHVILVFVAETAVSVAVSATLCKVLCARSALSKAL